MARPIWKGSISLGLVNIPVALMPAERRSDLKFSLVDSRDLAKVRYQRVNEVTGEEVPWDRIAKGYEYDGDHFVLMTDEDFEKAEAGTGENIDIEDFVDREEIPFLYFDKPYYLEPGKNGAKGYVLLRDALVRTGKAGIARIVIRKREHLAALIPHGRALILEILRFHQELRPMEAYDFPEEDPGEYGVTKKETDMAVNLVQNMAVEWDPEKYHDAYRQALLDWIRQKAEAEGATPGPSREKPAEKGEVIDMMDLLKQSVEETRKGKGGGKGTKKSSGGSGRKKKAKG